MDIHPKQIKSETQTTLICILPKLSNMHKKVICWLSAMVWSFILSAVHAQDKSKTLEPPKATADTSKQKKPAGITDKVKSSKKTEGLFTLYQDTVTGSVQIFVK